MSKIYNEIVIDMNPESPTFEETLYEDSFEYSGDMMLAQGDPFSGGDIYVIDEGTGLYTRKRWDPDRQPPRFTTMENNVTVENIPSGGLVYETTDAFNDATGAMTYGSYDETVPSLTLGGETEHHTGDTTYTKATNYGAPLLTRDDFFNPDGSRIDAGVVAQTLLDAGAGSGKGEVDDSGNPTDITDIGEMTAMVLEFFPQLEEIDPTEAGFLSEQYGGDGTSFADSLEGTQSGITYDKAGITYRGAGITHDKADLAYGAAGRAYKTAGLQKDTMLSGLQDKTYQVGAPTTGRDLRGAMQGKQKIKKGFETGMDMYGLAGEAYGAAGKTHRLAGETYDLASDTYDLALDTYNLDESMAGLNYRKGMYDLEYGREGTYTGFENEIQNIFFKEGGRVPSKENFSTFLTQLPDAGGM